MPPWLDHLREVAIDFTATLFWAVIGRLLYHTRLVQQGKRPFIGKQLWLEFPVALGLGFVADGLASWLSLTGKPAVAVIVSVLLTSKIFARGEDF
ncbi:MAG: hypothetical protein H7840_18215 [Alphaproteobacteria bacterium]